MTFNIKARLGDGYLVAAGVFVFAVCIRLPACWESFWLDELHSAWSVWGSLSEVSSRAAAGNQTAIYFWLLWLWKQVTSDSELALRLPNVLATSLAAAIITIGIQRTRGSLLAGAVAGLVMALEPSAIFFGTELRPFAMVILLGAVACYLTTLPIKKNDRALFLITCVYILAGAFQPTSLGVIGWLLATRFGCRLVYLGKSKTGTTLPVWTSLWTINKRRLAIISPLVVLCGWATAGVIGNAWRHRVQWSSMGRADSLIQIWQAWPWLSLVVLPILTVLAIGLIGRATQDKGPQQTLPWWFMSVIAAAVVVTFWITSAVGIAPVFHRRYFVGSLPILIWGFGDTLSQALYSIGLHRSFDSTTRSSEPTNTTRQLVTVRDTEPLLNASRWYDVVCRSPKRLVAILLIAGTLITWRSSFQGIRRGEGWREAVEYLQQRHQRTTNVALSPGLIETARLLSDHNTEPAAAAQRYLAFPLSGPYSWEHVTAFDFNDAPTSPALPVVIRSSRSVAERWLAKHFEPNKAISPKIHSFGAVQLIDYESESAP